MNFIFLLIAGLAGALMAIQGTLNSSLGKNLGLLHATFGVFLLGLITTGILLFFVPLKENFWSHVTSTPYYSWLGGPIGVAIIYGVAVSIPKLGVGVTTTSIIFFQLLAAYFIDHFGLFGQHTLPFTWYKSLGILFMVLGSYLLLRK